MRFRTDSAEWIGEVKSYLTGSSMKIGEIKKVLKGVDFEQLSYVDRVRLSRLFDPAAEITDELFKKQLDLYFSLLESKSSPMQIPVFSEYIEWVYSQDPKRIPDKMFEMMTSRLAKSKAQEIPEAVASFMAKLPQEFSRDIDNMSNSRLNTLIGVLKELESDFDNLPKECQDFVKNMFIACSVKTEVADKNKREIRGMFRDDLRGYYNIFNKAFARYGQFETWIDEPAKKLTLKNMVNYANFQESVIKNCRDRMTFSRFEECAKSLNLPRIPDYDSQGAFFRVYYLREPREYKDYAKKMSGLFSQLVRSEVFSVAKQAQNKTLTLDEMSKFATTHKMARKIERIGNSANAVELGMNYADVLIDLVHLDELTGQSKRDIISSADVKKAVEEAKPKQLTLEDFYHPELSYEELKVIKELSKELAELYEEYHELCEKGEKNQDLEEKILLLEDKIRDLSEVEKPAPKEKM